MSSIRARQPDLTRHTILDAAMWVMQDKGLANFTLDAVVEQVPFSKGALLHHFPSKSALLEGVVDRLAQEYVYDVEVEAARDPRPVGRYARAKLRLAARPSAACGDISLVKVVLAACLLDPELCSRWEAQVAQIADETPEDLSDADDILLQTLVADGLWLSDIFEPDRVTADQRRAVLSLLGCAPAEA